MAHGMQMALLTQLIVKATRIKGSIAVESCILVYRLDNQAGSGIHVGPSGIEFDERVLALGANAEARFGASVGFPRQLPVQEGQQLFNWDIHRLGLKTRW